MYADVAVARGYEALERGLLGGIEHVARSAEENDDVVAGKPTVGEHGSLF